MYQTSLGEGGGPPFGKKTNYFWFFLVKTSLSTRGNVQWEIYYYPQGSLLRVDIYLGDLLWKYAVSLRTPTEMSTV